jgi:ArsR family transcriptional regulator
MSSSAAELATDIGPCQYRCMSKSLTMVSPDATAACCPPGSPVPLSSDPASPVACCAPLSQGPLSAEQAEQVAPLLKALADPVRLRLMSLVASHRSAEACVCDLTDEFDLSQPTISHHLKILHDSGLLDREKRGVWVYYRVRTQAMASLGTLIGSPPA